MMKLLTIKISLNPYLFFLIEIRDEQSIINGKLGCPIVKRIKIGIGIPDFVPEKNEIGTMDAEVKHYRNERDF